MKNRLFLASQVIWLCLALPVQAAGNSDAWNSVAQQIDAIKGTFDSNVAKQNAQNVQTIYSQLDTMRTRDESRFLVDLSNQPGKVQLFLCRYLESRKVKNSVPVLIKVYDRLNEKTETSFLRDSIVTTIAGLDAASNRKFFLGVLSSKDNFARMAAVQALGNLPEDHATVTALRTTLLSDTNPMVRREAAFALGNFPKDEWAKQGLEEAQRDGQDVERAIKMSLNKLKNGK